MIDKIEGKTEAEKTEEEEELMRQSCITDFSLLFTKEDLSLSDIRKIRRGARYNPRNRRKFRKMLQEGVSSDLPEKTVRERTGIGWWIMNEFEEARKVLAEADTDLSRCVHALSLRDQGKTAEAVSYLESLPAGAKKGKNVRIATALLLYAVGAVERGEMIAEHLFAAHPEDPEVMKVKAMYAAETGEAETALEIYREVLKREPADEETLFHYARFLERIGEDRKALRCYEKAANVFPTHVNTVLNLGQKYYEMGDTEKAAFCFKRVLKIHPTHALARRFLVDISATDNMYYDEKKAKEKEELNKILQIPVSDFELSVRSRNCLNRMNIRTLGDLIKKTEADLLAYKNFGETSLAEIKRMLASKGLYLGQAKDMQNQELKEKHKRKILNITDHELMEKSVKDLELSVRATKCLDRLNIKTFGELIRYSEEDLLKVRNFGQTSLAEIKQKLASYGLSLKNSS